MLLKSIHFVHILEDFIYKSGGNLWQVVIADGKIIIQL